MTASTAQLQGSLATCECAVPQIKPAWDGHGRLVCEDCHGQIARAAKMSGQIARPGEPDNAAIALLREGLILVMYGERAPGGDETWGEWARKAEALLRSVDEQ